MTLDKNWVLGFIEGEGCFSIIFKKSGKDPNRRQAIADFTIKLTETERDVLEKLQQFFGGIGHIYFQSSDSNRRRGIINSNDCWAFKVTKLKEVKKVADFFDTMDFVSDSKKADFELWKKCMAMIERKEHLKREGILKIAILREKLHRRKQWNKKNFCQFRNTIEKCSEFIKKKKIPENCDLCRREICT